jgi:hypothetical protein
VTEVGGEHRQSAFNVLSGTIPAQQGFDGESMPQMPHAAFAAECRGQENAE